MLLETNPVSHERAFSRPVRGWAFWTMLVVPFEGECRVVLGSNHHHCSLEQSDFKWSSSSANNERTHSSSGQAHTQTNSRDQRETWARHAIKNQKPSSLNFKTEGKLLSRAVEVHRDTRGAWSVYRADDRSYLQPFNVRVQTKELQVTSGAPKALPDLSCSQNPSYNVKTSFFSVLMTKKCPPGHKSSMMYIVDR